MRKTIDWKINSYFHTFNFYINPNTIKQFLGGTGQARNQDCFSTGEILPKEGTISVRTLRMALLFS